MQIPPDPLDAAALDEALRPGQVIYHRDLVEIDWNRDGSYAHALSDVSSAVATVEVNRERNTGAPGASVVLSGASAGQLKVILNGHLTVDDTPAPVSQALAPSYATTSPLHGLRVTDTPIRWTALTHTARGWIGVRQFTGWIDQRQIRASSNQVTITALDIPPGLRAPVHWPPWAVDGPACGRIGTYEAMRGLASSAVDAIFNAAGLRTRPRPPWESHPAAAIGLCWLPLCGSFAPAAGKQISQHPWGNSQLFQQVYPISPGLDPNRSYWVDGPFGLARDGKAGVDAGALIYTARDSQPRWTGRSTSVSTWIWCGPGVSGFDPSPGSTLRPQVAATHLGFAITSNYYAYRVSIGSAGSTVQAQFECGTDRHYFITYTPPSTGWRHVHAELDHSAGPVRGKLWVDGVLQGNIVPTGTSNSVAATALLNLWLPQVGFHLRPGVRMCDAMSWQETGSPTITPERTVAGGVRATVDRSLNEITHLPRPGESGWVDLDDLSMAEGAAITVDEQGWVYWQNRLTSRSRGSPRTITLDYPEEVGVVDTEMGTANTILVSAQPGEASWQLAWQLPSVDSIVARPGVSTWVFPVDDHVIAIESGTVPRLYQSAESASTVPVWSSSVNSGYVFVYDGSESEELADQNMVNLTDQTGFGDGQYLRLVVRNSSTSIGRFRLKSDPANGVDHQPALRIAGLILARPAVAQSRVRSAANVAADGAERTISLPAGPWSQHLPSVEAIARFLLRTTTQPIPAFDRFDVVGDPRGQVADPLVLELGAQGPRVRAYVAGITRRSDGKNLRDELVVQATHAPGRWALGDPVLGRLGDTAVLG